MHAGMTDARAASQCTMPTVIDGHVNRNGAFCISGGNA